MLVVDEAHHARRKDFKERIYRPNRLLGLLNEINTRTRLPVCLLMTATPMQVHPLEVWDLLTVLGMGGRWAADYVFRNTRSLLREYQRRGILKATVPTRRPRRERVPCGRTSRPCMTALTNTSRISIKSTNMKRRGLGFVMTVYRRRLTSSFYAVRKSLERRLKFLRGLTDEVFDDDDLEQDELDQDIEDLLGDAPRDRFKVEIEYVQSFIQSLQLFSTTDSKLAVLKDELQRVFMQRSTVLVFTQYGTVFTLGQPPSAPRCVSAGPCHVPASNAPAALASGHTRRVRAGTCRAGAAAPLGRRA